MGDHVYLMSSLEDTRGILGEFLSEIKDSAGTIEDVVFAFSGAENWRKRVLPTYKSNRKGTRKPLAYNATRLWIEQTYPTICEPGLEADDLMGIYASRPGYAIWTADKDLLQCPGTHLIDDAMVEITKAAGDRFHYQQVLTGDPTDGYQGCPGVGAKAAEEFLDAPYIAVPTERVLKTGKRAGETQLIWNREPTEDIWAGIVSLYAKAGLTEADALVQARVSRILRDGEYDFETKRVKLWKPRLA